MKTFKSGCGCEIHVIKWSAKANSVTVKNCALHKSAPELLEACKAIRCHTDTCQFILFADREIPFPCNCGYALARTAIRKAEGL